VCSSDLANKENVECLKKAIENPTTQNKKDFFNLLPDEYKNHFNQIGIMLPTETVDITLTLGDFLFDIIVESIPKPTAPLKLAAYNKGIGDLAEKLLAPEFELTESELDAVRKVMDDDVLWGKVKVDAELNNSGKTLVLSQTGISIFDKVIQGAVNIFIPLEEKIQIEEEKIEEKTTPKRGRKKKV
jgi:hypothetical protein